MSHLKSKFFLGIIIGTMSCFLTYADESEIYFALTNTTGLKPNVFFILDVSGSMDYVPDKDKVDSARASRMDHLRNAMYGILASNEIKKTNVGAMDFSDKPRFGRAPLDAATIEASLDINVKSVSGDEVTFVQPIYSGFDNGVDITSNITIPVLKLNETSYTYKNLIFPAFAFRFDNILLNNTVSDVKKVEFKFVSTQLTLTSSDPSKRTYKIFTDAIDSSPHLDTLFVTDNTVKKIIRSSSSFVECYVPNVSGWATCDVTPLIQAKISRPGWKAGNAISLYFERESGKEGISLVFDNVVSTEYSDIKTPYLKITANKAAIADNTRTQAFQIEQYVKNLRVVGGTATVPTMLYAAKYFSNIPKANSLGPYHDNTNPSPIERSCQTTSFIVMSDGDANVQSEDLPEYIGNPANCSIINGVKYTEMGSRSPFYSGDKCGRYLAHWLATTPQSTFGDNYINTYSIGFGAGISSTGESFLRDIAKLGKGQYYTSANATELLKAFSDIVNSIIIAGSPALSGQVVNAPTSVHDQRKEAYYTIFESTDRDYWSGNLKGFFIKYEPLTLPNGFVSNRPVLKGQDNATSALNSDGTFVKGASSFWSSNDAENIDIGGVVGQLPDPSLRNVYTQKDSVGTVIELKAENSGQFTDAQMGTTTEIERKNLLNFIRGYEYSTLGSTPVVASKKKIADGSRALAAIATYGCDDDLPLLKCETNSLKQTILFPSNDGVLRGFNAVTGKALYEFMPSELLGNINKMHQQKGVSRTITRTYGLDGTVKIQHDDKNKNGYIDSDDGEKAYAFVTAGRSGRFVYILNITSQSAKPEVVKVITNLTSGFSKLGYAWSVPAAGKIKVGGDVKNVFIFGAGYDPKQDDNTERATDSMGNALYIVDTSGNLIWSSDTAGVTMDYSVPGSPAVLVNETTGLISDIVVADMGGQLWRFGVNNGSSGSSLITKAGDNGMVASIASSGVANSRRFYVTPVLYPMLNPSGGKTISVSIGSGYFGHPLNKEVSDKLYVFFLPTAAAAGTVINESMLGSVGSATKLTSYGFYVPLGTGVDGKGEKVITNLKTDFNRVVFNTYVPNTKNLTADDVCTAFSGKQRTYVYSLLNGESMLQSEYIEIGIKGLPSDVALYCSGRACTFITSPGELSGTVTLPKDKDGNYVTNKTRCGPGADREYCTYSIGWSDLFDPEPK